MTRFDSKVAAAALVSLGAVYMVASLATGRSAKGEILPDLSPRATDLALDVWQAASVMAEKPGTILVDTRPSEDYSQFHVHGAVNRPGAGVKELHPLLGGAPAVIVYGAKDDEAQRLVTELRKTRRDAPVYYLREGARAWYLAFQLPTPLFAEGAPPRGYAEAMGSVRAWLAGASKAGAPGPREALQTLAKLNYQPTLLKAGKKPAAKAGGGKKISGGCG